MESAATDADQAYLRQVTLDCQRVLGPEIRIGDLEVNTDNGVVMRLSYSLDGIDWSSEGRGESMVAAHGDLRQRLVLDRVRLGAVALHRWRRR